jgi:hypothetical protein
VTALDGWAALGDLLMGASIPGIFAVVLAAALLCAVGGYLVIRKATPRS